MPVSIEEAFIEYLTPWFSVFLALCQQHVPTDCWHDCRRCSKEDFC